MIKLFPYKDIGIMDISGKQYTVHISTIEPLGDIYFIDTLDPEPASILSQYCFHDLPKIIGHITWKLEAIPVAQIEVAINRLFSDLSPSLSFRFRFDIANWNRSWSIKEYIKEYSAIVNNLHPVAQSYSDSDIERYGISSSDVPSFTLSFSDIDTDSQIQSTIHRHFDALRAIDKATITSLSAKTYSNSLITIFDFPESVKVPCEQYLLYFIQFLKDVGVKATAELREEAGHVLFSVTPDDNQEALEKIRQALDIYLHLPANPGIGNEMGYGIEPAVQMLGANIQHLRGQLMMQSALLQAKDATIQIQQATIAQQQALLTGQILIQSVQSVTTTKDDDKETILGGAADITVYEGEGFNINLPFIYRKLRELFAKDKH